VGRKEKVNFLSSQVSFFGDSLHTHTHTKATHRKKKATY
jgi:hypothetical protein